MTLKKKKICKQPAAFCFQNRLEGRNIEYWPKGLESPNNAGNKNWNKGGFGPPEREFRMRFQQGNFDPPGDEDFNGRNGGNFGPPGPGGDFNSNRGQYGGEWGRNDSYQQRNFQGPMRYNDQQSSWQPYPPQQPPMHQQQPPVSGPLSGLSQVSQNNDIFLFGYLIQTRHHKTALSSSSTIQL